MDEVLRPFKQHGVRYPLIGGQAVRLEEMPRFSMDRDLYIPPKDAANIEKINRLLGDGLDLPVLPIGAEGENFVQTCRTRWGIIQFHPGGPGLPEFDAAEKRAVTRRTETGTDVRCMGGRDLLEHHRLHACLSEKSQVCFGARPGRTRKFRATFLRLR